MKQLILRHRASFAALGLAALPCMATASDYAKSVLADNPAAFYRLGDSTVRGTNNLNSGLATGVVASQNLGRVHTMPGAIAGDAGRAAFFDFTSRTEIPWNAALNPKNDKPFTVEAWFYPTSDQTATGQCPINNRFAYSGVDRQGWVFFQRKPNADYAGGDIQVDGVEIAEAQWFSVDSLPNLPGNISISRRLIEDAIAELRA